MPKNSFWFILCLMIFSIFPGVQGQFYNGHQMEFGKNRVQYNDFYWQWRRYDKYDVYFNQNGRELADYAADFAAKEIPRIENYFDYNLDSRIILLVYNKLSDFRQSNIGLVTGKVDYNIGGTTTVNKNKVFVYFEGDYKKFEEQITAAITRVLLNEMLYGSQLKDNLANSTLLNLPAWYVEGLISYISKDWNFNIENRVKDGILSGKYEKFNRLEGEDAVYAGHSFWRYIADTYGKSVIPSIIYLTRINKNSSSGFSYVLGMSLKELSYDWMGYYTNLYTQEKDREPLPESGKVVEKPKKKLVYQQLKISPSGKYIAYVTNQSGKYKVWVYNTETGKRKKVIRRGNNLKQITDYSFPILAWHPSGRILTFFTEEDGGIKLYYYSVAEKKLDVRNFLYFEKVLSYSFSDDGSLLVLSAVRNGKSDIYVYNIASATHEQITDDIADDADPRFINNSTQIIFSSNRASDTLTSGQDSVKRALYKDLFIYDYKHHSKVLMRLSDNKYVDKIQPYETGHNKFILLSDKTGIINRYVSEFDSTISFVDTTIHYRYYAITNPLTNYSRNILEQDYNKKTGNVGEIFYKDGKYYTYNLPMEDEPLDSKDIAVTAFRKQYTQKLEAEDSIRNIKKTVISIEDFKNNTYVTPNKDTLTLDEAPIDINNYVFESEKLSYYQNKFKDKNLEITVDTTKKERPKVRIYQTAFYQNYLVNQVDFSFLNASYQAFTGGAVYFNPGTNLLFKIGTNDLFENYKIVGGMRFPLDFDSNEYLISVEDLKKRLDKQLIFHRQVFKNVVNNSSLIKTYTHEVSLILRYPFNQVSAWVRTLSFRNDHTVYLSTDPNSLEKPDISKTWVGFKMEYIFDNTRSLGINLYTGTRSKVFGELYQEVNDKFDNLVVLGVDFRNYIRLHRSLIWANRFAASTSLGSSRLIYYLGGVDNWTNLTPMKNPTFIPLSEIRINPTRNYAYQAVATNLRGFSQNIRNGESFALINSEVRWPIIRYFMNYPLSNSFLENFQVIGFFDIGTAWSGNTPWSGQNAYDHDIIEQGPITVNIDTNRDPIVAGFGYGVRSQLFGYFVRLDWAWGIENYEIHQPIFYFSLATDF